MTVRKPTEPISYLSIPRRFCLPRNLLDILDCIEGKVNAHWQFELALWLLLLWEHKIIPQAQTVQVIHTELVTTHVWFSVEALCKHTWGVVGIGEVLGVVVTAACIDALLLTSSSPEKVTLEIAHIGIHMSVSTCVALVRILCRRIQSSNWIVSLNHN